MARVLHLHSRVMDHLSTNEGALTDRICALSGITERDLAERVGLVVTELLMEQLALRDRDWLAGELPRRWVAEAMPGPEQMRSADTLDDFFVRVAVREGVEIGSAREHAQSCCRALAEAFGDDARRHLASRLSDDVASLFEVPEPAPEHPKIEGHRDRAPRSTLSEGRPVSRTPISGAAAERAQQASVARSQNPHGDTKLSSSHGTTQEREDETLAEGRSKAKP